MIIFYLPELFSKVRYKNISLVNFLLDKMCYDEFLSDGIFTLTLKLLIVVFFEYRKTEFPDLPEFGQKFVKSSRILKSLWEPCRKIPDNPS
jgi:hypothetical protein